MLLLDTINVDKNTQIYVKKSVESLEELQQEVSLSNEEVSRLEQIKPETDKKNFLSVRKILKMNGYAPGDLTYNEQGKPLLNDGKYISISHSRDMVAVAISKNEVGVDIELKQDRFIQISPKFTPWKPENTSLLKSSIVQKLTMIWTAKEAAYKAYGKGDITINQILVKDFFPNDTKTKVKVAPGEGEGSYYRISFMQLEDDFVLACCLPA
ncbi:4'-phosphopantetheinyl transferase family protein [Capnocytophaga canimorsus]|uniref:Gramicidin synthase-activating enzyme n=2 Tax=Capnocytophaga canimorsus TaxID=28188 RepID=F9YR96_CAPCC|nr:4'-phosphopantetheinyl transferase superfamily protein [Capnocytophaga canimorsus]AEK22454.1 Gramicidin synthase-activating enzyme [Capnocytophaga canimorsus Cc5]ATA94381.1 hypothetical protein CGC54_08575 [Capnocytophaga canimorsus]VEJ19842.1 holo-(acyl carrier protein) synthase 2 [Capnocytophaga canimorsus]